MNGWKPWTAAAAAALCTWLALAGAACNPGPGTLKSGASAAPSATARLRPLDGELRPVYQLITQGRLVEARAHAERFLAQRPNHAQALLFIGMTFAKADNQGAARPWFERALASDPAYYIGHEYLADALFKLGELEAAREHYEAWQRFAPDEPRSAYQLGLIDFEHGELDAARGQFEAAVERMEALQKRDPRMYTARAPELAGYHARLGDLYFARGKYAEARAQLARATTLCPGNISAFYTLSLVLRRLGEDALADEALARYEGARAELGGALQGTAR